MSTEPDAPGAKKPRRRGGPRPGAGRPRQPEIDDRILSVTVEMLLRDGYSRLTLDDVASQAGVARTTVYRRWPAKPALVLAAVGGLTLRPPAMPDTGSLRGDLTMLAHLAVEAFTGAQGRVLEVLVRDSGAAPELTELVRESVVSRRRGFYAVLSRAIERGEVPPGLDLELATDLFVGVLWTRLLITGSQIDLALGDAIVDAVVAALSGWPAAD